MEALAQGIRKLINFVAAVNLDGLSGGVVGDDTVIAFA